MATIRDDIQAAAEWISQALTPSGYDADFSPNSLVEVDRFFSEYSGEVVRRHAPIVVEPWWKFW